MRAVLLRRCLLFFTLVVVGCGVDLATKSWIFAKLRDQPHRSHIWLIDNVFGLTTSLNEGALFGIGQGRSFLFAALSLVAAAAILYWLFWLGAARDLLLTFALGLITGGILGNLYDRLGLHGLKWESPNRLGEPVYAVRDWLDFAWIRWPVFNIADSLLVCGAGLLLWHAFIYAERPSSPAPADSSQSLA